MGRFLAIAILLVAIALLANKYLLTENPADPPAGEKEETPVAQSDDAPKEDESVAPPETPSAPDLAAAKLVIDTVLLGGDELVGGVPGFGDLTVEQIDAWISDPNNHHVLKPELPLGLAAGAGEVKGLEANPLTRAKIELGRQLYFDTRLSVDNTISCASCHAAEFGFAHETQFGVGVKDQTGDRNSPVAYNRILSGPQFWDGRAADLEAQAVGPIENPIEMGNTHAACVETVQGIEGYQKQFAVIFDDGVTIDNIGRAIASFERVLVTGPAPWDYHLQLANFEKAYADDLEDLDELKAEDEELYNEYMALKEASDSHPIGESAIRGGELFFSDKSGCTACHVGANFTDELYHNLGVGMAVDEPDMGRFKETAQEKDRGAFKTPTVRNIAMTAPYMHDGSQKTLEEVMKWYVQGGHPNDHLSEKIKKLDLSEQEVADLVAFMREGLASPFPKVEVGRLP